MILFWVSLVTGILFAITWIIRKEREEIQMCYICDSMDLGKKTPAIRVILSSNAKSIVKWYVTHHPYYAGHKEGDVVKMLIELGCKVVEKNNPADPLDPEIVKGLIKL